MESMNGVPYFAAPSSELNVSVSYVAAVSVSAPVATDQWHTLTTSFKGDILQVGSSAGVVSAGVDSDASIVFAPKFAVQITLPFLMVSVDIQPLDCRLTGEVCAR
jgi:hypothetical protein